MSLTLLSTNKCFDGEQRVYGHYSNVLNCKMKFGVYVPPIIIESNQACPVIYFLSGLTCTHENFIQKSGMQKYASQYGLVVINPDTSPRNVNISSEDDSYDFGSGAGFYIDASEIPWRTNYQMYSYITDELVKLIENNLPIVSSKKGIFGHSMGGHGALICALKNPGFYKSVSAFAPIANPMQCPWGKKAFKGYLGMDETVWQEWDATSLVTNYKQGPMELFIDQGSCDQFLQEQLLTENLLQAAAKNDNLHIIFKQRKGYDHSYYYIASFIEEHIAYHAKILYS